MLLVYAGNKYYPKVLFQEIENHVDLMLLLGEEDKPLPNIFIEIIKYLFGFIALFFPIKPSLRI